MSAVERVAVVGSTVVLAVTGAAFFVMKYLMRGTDPFSAWHHPWQPHALSLHVIAAPIGVFAIGLAARGHMVERLADTTLRRGRGTGLLIAALAAPMILSAPLVQVLGATAAGPWMAGIHIVASVVFLAVFVAHLLVARAVHRRTAAREPRAAEPPAS